MLYPSALDGWTEKDLKRTSSLILKEIRKTTNFNFILKIQ
jgi:hypothetical protein